MALFLEDVPVGGVVGMVRKKAFRACDRSLDRVDQVAHIVAGKLLTR